MSAQRDSERTGNVLHGGIDHHHHDGQVSLEEIPYGQNYGPFRRADPIESWIAHDYDGNKGHKMLHGVETK